MLAQIHKAFVSAHYPPSLWDRRSLRRCESKGWHGGMVWVLHHGALRPVQPKLLPGLMAA